MANPHKNGNKGFSLIELLIVMAMFLIVMTAIYSTYMHQQRSYMVQESLVAMEQNLRTAMFFLRREIRMAGFDETGASGDIQGAEKNRVEFTLQEIDDTGTTMVTKTIEYDLYDSMSDGNMDLGRSVDGSPREAIAENIEVLDFVYLDVSGNNVDTDGDDIISNSEMDRIKFVEVTIVARTDRKEIDYTDNNVYRNKQLDSETGECCEEILTPTGDDKHYRRRISTARIMCRNL